MAIIGITGKKQSGKDTVGKIVQYLTYESQHRNDNGFYYPVEEWITDVKSNEVTEKVPLVCNYKWQTVRFADKLKDIVCLLIGCTREQLEDEEFKNKPLGEEWTRYGYANGFDQRHRDGMKMSTVMNNEACSKERYERERITNWQTVYKTELTPRLLLQLLGTNCCRNIIHPDTWVNSTMSNYIYIEYNNPWYNDKGIHEVSELDETQHPVTLKKYPNWIIPDVRFPNEVKAIEDRQGLLIKVVRNLYNYNDGIYTLSELFNVVHKDTGEYPIKTYADDNWLIKDTHESEIALDDHNFEHVISNDGTIEDLVGKVKAILIKEKIIK